MPTYYNQIMQSIGFLGPAFFLTQLKHVKTSALAVLCMACSQGVLLGLSNTTGVLAGVFGTAATRYILQKGTIKLLVNLLLTSNLFECVRSCSYELTACLYECCGLNNNLPI